MTADHAAELEALHPDAFGWAMHCCGGDQSLAEDVLQTAYVKVAEERARFDGQSAFRTWWFGVIRFTALEELRRMKFRQSMLGRLLLRQATPALHPSPAEEMAQSERARHLRTLLAELPARQAEALHLVFYQDLTLAEAAEIMCVSLGSVRQHYERGKTRLRELLKHSPLDGHE